MTFPLWVNVLSGFGAFIVILENALVLCLVLFKRKLHTYTNGFVVSLAISDFLLGAIFVPAYLVHPGDDANGYLVSLFLYTNVANICGVTLERYIAVMKPLMYEVIMLKHFVKMLIISWIFPIAVSLLPLCWGNEGREEESLVHKLYIGFLLVVCTILPCIFLVVSYCLIFSEVLRQMKLIRLSNTPSYDGDSGRDIVKEGKVALAFAAVSVIFLATWIPSIYMTFTSTILKRPDLIPEKLWYISFFLILISSASNAIIYAFCKEDFRTEILAIYEMRKKSNDIRNTNSFS